MLRYFKKPSQTYSEYELQTGKKNRHSNHLSTDFNDRFINLDDLFDVNEAEETMLECNSRLAMNINSIIREKGCLVYFVQFLETKNGLSLIKFYLDTENFKTASENIKAVKANHKITENIYKNENNPVHGLVLCHMSMQKSLTDDEKSQIYANSNKHQMASIISSINHTCKTSDAICIYNKYLMPSSEHFVLLPVEILSEISLIICKNELPCHAQKIPTTLFENARGYILQKLEHEYLSDFLQSNLYCKYCIELLTSSKMTLIDILHSESALFYFMEYLEQKNQRGCLDFWIAAINFRKHYENKLESYRTEAQSDAMIIYEKYFSLQAESPLRISDRIRSIVEEAICSNNLKSAISRCFDRPLKVIENYLEKKFFPCFIKSNLYAKYVHVFQSKLSDHKCMDICVIRNTKYSDTLSDFTNKNSKDIKKSFISQHNTLLAMESHGSYSQINSSTVASDMHIDSRHFVYPDMLWQRPDTSLTFGRVNSLGRYERDFDICPSGKNWSLSMGSIAIKNAMRKLTKVPEDKMQEEIAWQIAGMIIDDVMSVTMSANGNRST